MRATVSTLGGGGVNNRQLAPLRATQPISFDEYKAVTTSLRSTNRDAYDSAVRKNDQNRGQTNAPGKSFTPSEETTPPAAPALAATPNTGKTFWQKLSDVVTYNQNMQNANSIMAMGALFGNEQMQSTGRQMAHSNTENYLDSVEEFKYIAERGAGGAVKSAESFVNALGYLGQMQNRAQIQQNAQILGAWGTLTGNQDFKGASEHMGSYEKNVEPVEVGTKLDEPVASEQQKNMEALTLNKSKKFGEFQDEHIDEIKQGRDALKDIGIQFFAIPSDLNAEKVAVFKKDLKNGNLDLSIRKQKQNEHIAGTKERKTRTDREAEKGKFSTYFYEDTDVEELISGLFGTGEVQYDSAKSLYPVEFISLEEPVGMAYNYGTGEYVEVKRIAIQYGGKGVHAYPVKDW